MERGGEARHHRRGMAKRQNRCSNIHMWWIKIRRDPWGVSNPSPKPDHSATQGSSAREINPHNFWL